VSEVVALLDLGSNAVRLLLARIRPGRGFAILEEERVQTRLGSGGQGTLPDAAVRKTLRAIAAFVEPARRRGIARVIALATAAVREARNAETLLEPLRQRYRADVRVLSGEEEARLGARAVLASLPIDSGVIVDLGGGSLQITRVRDGEPGVGASLPLGAVRMTARFLRHDPPASREVRALRREVRERAADALPRAADGAPLIGLGGTIHALARIARGGRRGKKIHGARLAASEVVAIGERLASLPLRRRRAVEGLKSDRADIVVAGAVIVEELMQLGGYEHLVVSAHGVRYGMLVEEAFGRMTPA
jgi:exopolyphosphatase/guanosine-5'-triphosphate,3'-diphosphate pyrophosphatase